MGGELGAAQELVLDHVSSGGSIPDVLNHVLRPALREVGRLWQVNGVTPAQEHVFTQATARLMGRLRDEAPLQTDWGAWPARIAIAACVSLERHDLGLRMVADTLELSGWTVLFAGSDTPETDTVELAVLHRAAAVAISATMFFQIRRVASLIDALHRHPGSKAACIIVGGRLFAYAPDLWQRIGADLTAPDPVQAAAALQTRCPRP
jgi:MerR family transcriptional regulator, light-induced transcriptional regulator